MKKMKSISFSIGYLFFLLALLQVSTSASDLLSDDLSMAISNLADQMKGKETNL
jgi:hypothetical protein